MTPDLTFCEAFVALAFLCFVAMVSAATLDRPKAARGEDER